MPTNANTFNSRITSEALEKKFRDVFPAQGGAELIQDLYAAGTIQPVIDFSTVAEGSILPENLQTAWDFSTGKQDTGGNARNTVISNTGFWKVTTVVTWNTAGDATFFVGINDGASDKPIFGLYEVSTSQITGGEDHWDFVVFLRSGDSLVQDTTAGGASSNVNLRTTYRQIADVNGDLVNPLGFTFS